MNLSLSAVGNALVRGQHTLERSSAQKAILSRPQSTRLIPDRRPILVATNAMLIMGQDTGAIFEGALVEK